MLGSNVKVTRWVISEDGNHLIRREEVEATFPKAVPAELPVSFPCAYCDICFTASHYLEKHLKRSHRKQYLEILQSQSITFGKTPPSTLAYSIKTSTQTAATVNNAPASTSGNYIKASESIGVSLSQTPASSSTGLIKTPTSTAAIYSKAPASASANFIKTPSFVADPCRKAPLSPPAVVTKSPTSSSATFDKTHNSSVGAFRRSPLQAAVLRSPKSFPSGDGIKSVRTSQSEEPQAPGNSTGPITTGVTLVTSDITSDPSPLPSALGSLEPSASAPSSGRAQMTVKPVPDEASTEDLPKPHRTRLDTEDVKKRAQKKRPLACARCAGGREGLIEGNLEKESSCEKSTLFLCNECGQSYQSFSSLCFHLDQAHGGKGQVPGEERGEEGVETLYLCTECGCSFPHLELLGHHQSLHDSPGTEEHVVGSDQDEDDAFSVAHTCSSCQKPFKTERYLKTHKKIHSGQVPYHCDQCGKSFTQLGDLKTHRRTHTGERPYQCSQCGKCFGRSGTLKKHWRTHTGETPYVCVVCSKQFNQLGALKTHERIHTGQQPYFCSHCSQHFTYSYQLKRHRCVQGDKSPGSSE